MSAQKLIDVLDKMCRLHELLLDLAVKKTDIIKQNDMNGLNQVLKDEQKYVAAINTMERERQHISATLTGSNGATLKDCLVYVTETEKAKLAELQVKLTGLISELKHQNELNQQLVYQSLQFVNLSMNMINPQPEQPTYTHPIQGGGQQKKRSMFDSQA